MQLKFFKREKVFKKGGFHSSPDIFWQFALSLGLLIVLSASVFGFLLFMRANEDSTIDLENGNGKSQVIDEDKLNTALEYFKTREENRTQILGSPSPAIDPSR